MQSPLHPEARLESIEIEPGLQVHRCPKSGGIWISIQSYLTWREGQAADPIERTRRSQEGAARTELAPMAEDRGRPALICPESGRLMIRYKAGPGLGFQLDRSPVTGGIWLDQGEWEALKARGLHLELPRIFTASYQRNVRSAGYEQRIEDTFRERIGGADFRRVLEFKQWLAGHPKRRDICCFLADDGDEARVP